MGFHLNSHTRGFHPQTPKLKPPYTAQQTARQQSTAQKLLHSSIAATDIHSPTPISTLLLTPLAFFVNNKQDSSGLTKYQQHFVIPQSQIQSIKEMKILYSKHAQVGQAKRTSFTTSRLVICLEERKEMPALQV